MKHTVRGSLHLAFLNSLPLAKKARKQERERESQARTGGYTQKLNDKDALKTTRRCAVPSCGKTVLALPSF